MYTGEHQSKDSVMLNLSSRAFIHLPYNTVVINMDHYDLCDIPMAFPRYNEETLSFPFGGSIERVK